MKVITAEGEEIDLGTVEATPTIGIIDFSRRVTDDFGVTTVVERGFSRRMTVRLALPFDQVDPVQRRLAELRATPVQWVADDRFAWLSVHGIYKDFELDLAVPPLSYCTLTVEGLAQTEAGADAGGDPAPAGSVSSLLLLQPVTISDAMLVASNVAEVDYPEWAAGTVYALGAHVIKAAVHRVYESALAGNVGHDPAAAEGQWIDVGPTNRWALFDQALGTVTTRNNGLALTLAPGAVDAVALLDVVGTTVRVQAAGYDQTAAVGAGPLIFSGLPLDGGQVTVTVAGVGPASVGTLLLGHLVKLGITGESPTAGITDFSRKDVDDFGEVTVVQRAWAKRMAARALIRTDAVDLVANRVASVRARPSLWIGDQGADSLTVYGFFKDFSIEVGENVSTLSLSLEGLSQAAPPAPAPTIAWPNVTDSDPAAHPRPEDGATVGAPGNTPVADRPASAVVSQLDSSASEIDQLWETYGDTESAATSAAAAELASQAADTARVASEVARDASQLAKAASQSASAASSSAASTAQTAATASQTASTASAAARDAAQAAQTSASTASSAAQTASTASAAARDAALAAQTAAVDAKNLAQSAATAAGSSASAAAGSASAASTSATVAGTSATSASGSANTASTKASDAATSASAAAGSASAASASQTAAGNSASAAQTARVSAESARDAAAGSASAASTSASNAASSATAAGNSASAAQTSATNASTSAGQASTSAGNASTSASQASTSASNAAGSASTASTQATNAANSATAAGGSATAAAGSASSAATSATNAGNSATSASGSANTASTQASNAASSASAAATSASAASASQTAAGNSASAAQTARVAAESARDAAAGSASAASTSASNAASSATAAGNSASAAQTSATNASTSAGQASTSAGNAATSASNASTSASQASTSASNAAGSASTAATQATNAANSATAAGSSASAASTSASQASSSASAAATSASAAQTSATQASTSAGNASTSASQASTSATNASGSASSASTSATAAATSAGAANGATLNGGRAPAAAPTLWAYNEWTPYAPTQLLSGYLSGNPLSLVAGRVRVPTGMTVAAGAAHFNPVGNVTISAGRRYKMRASVAKVTAESQDFQAAVSFYYSYWASGSTAAASPNASSTFVASTFPVSAGLTTFESPTIGLAGSGATHVLPSGTTVARGMVRIATEYGSVTELATFEFVDVEDLLAAASSASAAATSASAAAASQTAAGNSASAAQTSATNAATSAGQAGTSASNASTSASQASTSASNAAGSASAAGTSATNAANSATAAGGSASAASGSASSASSSASAASISASGASASSVTATLTAASLLPSDFREGGKYWTGGTYQGSPETRTSLATTPIAGFTFPTVNGAPVAQVAGGSFYDLATVGLIRIQSGRRYRLTCLVTTTSAAGAVDLFAIGLQGDYTLGYYKSLSFNYAQNVWSKNTLEIDADALITGTTGQGSAAATYLRPMLRGAPGLTWQAQYLRLDDITSEYAAAGSASAAATSASAASASQTAAGTSATSASTSANTASTGATNASNSASAAATSASGASASQTAAGNSATSASTSANTATTQAGNASSSASAAATSASAASASAASASQSATLSASIGINALNPNATFSDYPTTPGFPTTWGAYASALTPTRVGGENGGYAARIAPGAGADGYIGQGLPTNLLQPNSWAVLECDLKLNSGSLTGGGFRFYWDGLLPDWLLPSTADITGAAVGAGVAGRIYRFRLLFRTPNTTPSVVVLQGMAHWTGMGSTAAANDVTFYRLAVRPASQAEIEARAATTNVASLQASVSTNSSAIATVDGRTQAHWAVSANAGGAVAAIEARAITTPGGAAASGVGIVAEEVSITNTVGGVRKRALRIVGGDAYFDGAVSAGTGVFLGNATKWAYQLKSKDFSVSDGTVVSFGVTFDGAPLVDFSTAGLAPLASGETYQLYAENLTGSGFTARLKIATPGTASAVSLTADTVPGSGPTRQIARGGNAESSTGNYSFSVQGTYSGYAYYVDGNQYPIDYR